MENAQKRNTSPSSALRAVFLAHPHSVGESYIEHLRMALGFAGALFMTALAAVVHALIPCLCETTARRRIGALHEKLQNRGSGVTVNDSEGV